MPLSHQLKSRLLTAVILIPIFVFLVLKLPFLFFCFLTLLFVLLGAWEWSWFLGAVSFPQNLIYPLLVLLIMAVSLILPIPYVLYVACIWWVLATVLVLIYPKGQKKWGNNLFLRGAMGIMVLIPCWLAINYIRAAENGSYVLLFLFVLIWTADSVAYFVGKKWGRHKLCPKVSPGKSVEGLLGALLASLLIALLTLISLEIPYVEWPWSLLLALVTVLFSVVGDLFESMLKRNVGLKDSGQLLPGHGGLLDRIDSLTAAAPIFAMGALWLGKIFT